MTPSTSVPAWKQQTKAGVCAECEVEGTEDLPSCPHSSCSPRQFCSVPCKVPQAGFEDLCWQNPPALKAASLSLDIPSTMLVQLKWMWVNIEINGLCGKEIHSPLATLEKREREDVIHNRNMKKRTQNSTHLLSELLSPEMTLCFPGDSWDLEGFMDPPSAFFFSFKKVTLCFLQGEKLIVTFLPSITGWLELFWEE